MRVIEHSDVPDGIRTGRSSKWAAVISALAKDKVVVLSAAEVGTHTSEATFRASIYEHAKRKGIKVSVRKDSRTGEFYLIPVVRPVPLTAVVEEWEAATEEEQA